ncbi:flagellar assembly protein FliW [Helicobacter himalayensis]|uniref:flagellar assembly protein FliW n=1 Tax=Helicobacter himalayensis TaxID=1591088 RepID=UPI00082CEBF6|nr:flagellar assembly protein FliW [Helicobacter himalayensis]
MQYEVKSPILGFENVVQVEFEKIDDVFCRISALDGSMGLILINPYALLKEYNFSIPTATELMLDLKQSDKIEVYCVLVVQSPIEDSQVSFLSPIVFNPSKKYIAQVVLNLKDYPSFGITKPIKEFLPKELLESLRP